MQSNLAWQFPLPRPHTGIPIANGTQGLLVWGEAQQLNLTVARSGFWDRRGGRPFQQSATFPELRRLLEAFDSEGIERIFGSPATGRQPPPSRQLGGGRLEISAAAPWTLHGGEIDSSSGEVRVYWTSPVGGRATVTVFQDPVGELAIVDWPAEVPVAAIRLRPAWDWVGAELEQAGCLPPSLWQGAQEWGFEQGLPQDDPLGVRVLQQGRTYSIQTAIGQQAIQEMRTSCPADIPSLRASARAAWQGYKQRVPQISLPDPQLQEIVDYGLYLQYCCVRSTGHACSLQGALMEEVKLPPWSNDYHFNVNIQMIHAPALPSNCGDQLQPLWRLLRSWLPQLRAAGQQFFGEPDALLLPHAVDDRCKVVGTFWTGTIDHACTAWMALLCWDAVRYDNDRQLLTELALPLLRGAFAGYWAMCDRCPDGRLSLPVCVSPEFKGRAIDAWGPNGSFQLAAAHAVARALQLAAPLAGIQADPRWQQLRDQLPQWAEDSPPFHAEHPELRQRHILLWQGQDLTGSHRHHSHLAAISPFKTLDPATDPELVENSLRVWCYRGAGAWSGWSVPWAASILAHCHLADAAVHWLHHWRAAFTNEGRACLHDAAFKGVSILDYANATVHPNREVMQLDGRFGALSAVFDLLLQEFNGELRPVPALPSDWNGLAFSNLRAPGGFLLDATIENRQFTRISVTSLHGNPLRLRLPDGRSWQLDTTQGQLIQLL